MVKEQEILFLGGDSINNSASSSKLIKKVIRELGQTDRENFVVVMLNTKLKPIGANLVSTGSLAQCTVQPREIIKAALNMPCKALILGHNHPSGDPSPSVEDKLITLMIMASAHLFDVQILDHLIVDMDSDAYQSFADEKIIEDTKHKVRGVMDQISRL
jgi:DNA repair protein RadC